MRAISDPEAEHPQHVRHREHAKGDREPAEGAVDARREDLEVGELAHEQRRGGGTHRHRHVVGVIGEGTRPGEQRPGETLTGEVGQVQRLQQEHAPVEGVDLVLEHQADEECGQPHRQQCPKGDVDDPGMGGRPLHHVVQGRGRELQVGHGPPEPGHPGVEGPGVQARRQGELLFLRPAELRDGAGQGQAHHAAGLAAPELDQLVEPGAGQHDLGLPIGYGSRRRQAEPVGAGHEVRAAHRIGHEMPVLLPVGDGVRGRIAHARAPGGWPPRASSPASGRVVGAEARARPRPGPRRRHIKEGRWPGSRTRSPGAL